MKFSPERERSMQRYMEKRDNRISVKTKKVKYLIRQLSVQNRPRVGGRFANPSQVRAVDVAPMKLSSLRPKPREANASNPLMSIFLDFGGDVDYLQSMVYLSSPSLSDSASVCADEDEDASLELALMV